MDNIITLCILLKEDKHKCSHMMGVFKKHPYIKFFPAIYWKTNMKKAINLYLNLGLNLKKKNMMLGSFCIWMSNIKLWLTCLKNYPNKKYFIVLEDDVILPSNFIKLIKKYYINTGIINKVGAVMLCPRKTMNCIGTLYTRNQIEHILDYIQRYPITGPLDVFLIEHNDFIKRYPMIPNLVYYNKNIKSQRHLSFEYKKKKNLYELINKEKNKRNNYKI